MKTYFILLLILSAGFFSCTKNSDQATPSQSGVGGSLARFTISGNYLYTVEDKSLTTYDISDPEKPVQKNRQEVAFRVETIFPYGDNLFIGGQTGMYIYNIKNPASPKKAGRVEHLRSCDPVVANDSIAFVTLRGGTPCSNGTNALYVYDTRNPLNLKEIYMERMDHPEGLGLKDSTLFVCDRSRIIVMNVKDPRQPQRIDSLSNHGEIYHDVIPYQNMLICMVKSGILLYDISDINHIGLLAQMKYQ